MTDALRSDRTSAPGDPSDRERDARIEELLLIGLDHYFSGEHELAINVWTRVLFLDRGHARARAYIERARGAVSERHREADELLHTGADALQRGDRATARRLLTSAMERGVGGEEALALLHRLERLDAASAHVESRAPRPAADSRDGRRGTTPRRDSRLAWGIAGVVMGIVIAGIGGGYLWIATEPLELGVAQAPAPAAAQDPLPAPAACELRLLRANALYTQGRLRDALALLEPGDADGRHKAGFDVLRATIQRQLLDAARQGLSPQAPPRK
jgi:hypothetical protein